MACAAEAALLRQHGHDVEEFIEHNRRVQEMSRLSVAAEAIWSRSSRRKLSRRLRARRPDVVHFHNTFCLILEKFSCFFYMISFSTSDSFCKF